MRTGIVTPKKIALMEEIKKDPAAYSRLKGKAKWEGITLHAALSGWGDPRTWDKPKSVALSPPQSGTPEVKS